MATTKREPPAEDLNELNQRIADEATKAQTDEATKAPTTAPPPKPTSKD